MFFRCIFAAHYDNNKHISDMKKLLLLIAALGVLVGTVSCGDDEPRRGDGVFTVNTAMINHIYNMHTDQVLGVTNTHNKLVIDTIKHIASLQLSYNDGSDKILRLDDLTAKPKRLGFYVLSSVSDNTFSGYVDFNEGAMRYRFTTADGIRVISTTPEVFFLKTMNTITYDDTTKTTTYENAMYQFDIQPSNMSASVKVMDIIHDKDAKYFINITAASIPYTVTANGFTFMGENIPTTAIHRAMMDSLGNTKKETDKYPFKTFNATVDLANDNLDANYMIGGSATVVATGKTYPDYTAY